MEENEKRDFEDLAHGNRTDALALLAKGTLGAIPVLGPILAEIVGAIIPEQRLDRVTKLVQMLARKLAGVERGLVESKLQTTQGIDLLEDGFLLAARALTDERIEQIAEILRSGITDEQARLVDKKQLMRLLGQLDDSEVILLIWYSKISIGERDEDFERKHRHIIGPKIAHSGLNQEQLDEVALFEGRRAHLVNLGLLKPRLQRPKRGQPISVDSVEGLTKPKGYDISPLGRLLLRTINRQSP